MNSVKSVVLVLACLLTVHSHHLEQRGVGDDVNAVVNKLIDQVYKQKDEAQKHADASNKDPRQERKVVVNDGLYVRAIPERFSGRDDDSLMRHILLRYALEKADPLTGKPTGRFYVDRAGAYELAMETIVTIMKMTGNAAIDYFNQKVPAAWARQDVNNDGVIEAERVPIFLRTIVNNVELALQLQA